MTALLTWIGIAFCVSQSAMFSGLNLALFSISRLRLEVEAAAKNSDAIRLLRMREDSNFFADNRPVGKRRYQPMTPL